MVLGFVVPAYSSFPPFSRAYFPALLDGVVLAADRLGYSVTIVLDKVERGHKDYQNLIRSRTVDGLLFAVTPADFRPFELLSEDKVPFVLINNYRTGLSSVDARPESGMRKAFSHATNLGHSCIGYITGDMAFRNATDRLDCFRKLCAEFGTSGKVVEGDFSKTSGYKAMGRLLDGDDLPTLIMTSSDREALGVLQYCLEHGIQVPRDLSVIGYDNLHPAQDIAPPLSTVHHPITDLGRAATVLLTGIIEGRISGPVQEFLDTDFVVRESTSVPRRVRFPGKTEN
ncbi:MAG: substrate-binding domain-containing protein [Rectinemataceae bacterium]|nr:substrate-binding domain-containing protein [Rectinemataceae bacterium]